MLHGGQWEGASSNAFSCFLTFLLECSSFDFCYCFCVLLLPSFSSVFLANVFQCILFDFCPISVCCCYCCGEKRLVNSIPFFMAMLIMIVIVDGERSSTSLSFWVCEADCQSLMDVDIVIIVTVIAVVYSFSTIIMGG
jgi:hypothetical protein